MKTKYAEDTIKQMKKYSNNTQNTGKRNHINIFPQEDSS